MKKILLACALLFCSVGLFAHPHMFIDSSVEYKFSESGLEGFFITWSFDDYFASSILMDYDLDRNDSFNEEEVADIESFAFANLVNYNYYLYVDYDGETKKIDTVNQFNAIWIDGKLLYRFFVPYEVSFGLDSKSKTVSVACFDEVFFCDIMFLEENPIEISGNEFVNADFEVIENKETVVEYDNSYQQSAREGKSFSGVASPFEAKITFSKK